HSRFRPPGCARIQSRLTRPGLTPRFAVYRLGLSAAGAAVSGLLETLAFRQVAQAAKARMASQA
ncbi:MAG: hypothetical protein ACO3NZ_10395, partial [Pirellulales bacterium]